MPTVKHRWTVPQVDPNQLAAIQRRLYPAEGVRHSGLNGSRGRLPYWLGLNSGWTWPKCDFIVGERGSLRMREPESWLYCGT